MPGGGGHGTTAALAREWKCRTRSVYSQSNLETKGKEARLVSGQEEGRADSAEKGEQSWPRARGSLVAKKCPRRKLLAA